MKKSLFFALFIVIFVIGGFFLWKTQLHAPTSDEAAATSTLPAIQMARKSFADTAPDRSYTIKGTYPDFRGFLSEQTQTDLSTYIRTSVDEYVVGFKKSLADVDSTAKNPSSFNIDFTPIGINHKVVSVKMKYSEYVSGAAHPNNFIRGVNYDITKNAPIKTLADFMRGDKNYLEFLSEYTRSDLKSQLGTDFSSLEEQVWEGTKSTPENFAHFVIRRDALVIVFNPYQIGPYALGEHEVKIPAEKVLDFVKEDTGVFTLWKK